MAKKNRKLTKAVKSAAKSGDISRKEIKKIMKIAPTAAKAINRIAKSGATVRTSAANYAVQRARATPVTPGKPDKPVLGTSNLGKTLGSMAAVPGYKPTGTGQNLFIKGQKLDSKGRIVTGQPVKKVVNQVTPELPSGNVTDTEIVPNPNQGLIDQINNLTGVIDEMSAANVEKDAYMQDYINSIQQSSQQQRAEMSNMFNAQLAQQDAAYQQAVQQQNLLAQQEEEAARAFMINQGRTLSPANLQIGATYGTPQLAGTQGFKYRPERTPTTAQVATAFTAPTLAAAAMTPQQQLQPTVLNV